MVKRLRTFVAELQEEIKGKEYEIRRLQTRIRKVQTNRDSELAKDAEVVKKDAAIQNLKKHLRKEERHNRNLAKRLARIKQFAELSLDGEVVPVKVMDALTKEGLRKLAEDMGIDEGDVIFVTRIDGWGRSVVKDLAEMQVKAVVAAASLLAGSDPLLIPAFHEVCVPLLTDTETGVQIRGKQGLCGKDTYLAGYTSSA
jgi:predicted RNase H-like nuclease (RuvC/YqgF family)